MDLLLHCMDTGKRGSTTKLLLQVIPVKKSRKAKKSKQKRQAEKRTSGPESSTDDEESVRKNLEGFSFVHSSSAGASSESDFYDVEQKKTKRKIQIRQLSFQLLAEIPNV